jgi:hypothetical protein
MWLLVDFQGKPAPLPKLGSASPPLEANSLWPNRICKYIDRSHLYKQWALPPTPLKASDSWCWVGPNAAESQWFHNAGGSNGQLSWRSPSTYSRKSLSAFPSKAWMQDGTLLFKGKSKLSTNPLPCCRDLLFEHMIRHINKSKIYRRSINL